MAGERVLPGAGLTAFWDLGDSTYKPAMDANLRLVSALLAGSVVSRTTSLPGTGTLGDIYIVPAGDTNGNDLAIWDGESGSEAWVYVTPLTGWGFYIADTNDNYQWDGTAWVEFAGAGGGGSSTFLGLSDTPGSFGTAGQVAAVNSAGDALEFVDAGSGGGSGYSETIIFEQDYGTTSGTAFDFSIDEYDEIRITGNNTTNSTLVLELSTDDGSSYVTTSGYYENWVQGSNDGGGTVDHIDLSGSGSGRWRCDLQSHNFATHPTRALLYYGNGSNFFEIGETRTFANAAHNRARVNFTGSMTGGVVQVIGIKYGAGGASGSSAVTAVTETTPDNTASVYDYAVGDFSSVDVVCQGLTTASSATIEMQFSTDGGSTFKSGGSDYAIGYTASTFETSSTSDSIPIGDNTVTAAQYIQTRVTGLEGTRASLHSSAFETSSATHRVRAGAALFDGPITHIRILNSAGANFNGGKISVTGLNKTAGGGGGGASTLGDLTDVSATGSDGDVLTKQADGSFALETPAASSGIATHSTGDFGVGISSPDKQLHVLTDPGAASILPVSLPSSGGVLIEANGLGAGATGSFPGITMCSVDAGCTHIHSINASGHWVHESEINFPTKEWRVRIDDETDGSRPAQRMSMDPTGRLIIDDLTNDSSTLAPYEGRLKVRGLQNGASPTVSAFNIRQDYNAAGRNPAISIGMDQSFDVNQLLIEAHYQNNWSSDVHFYTRDTTSGADGLNSPYSNMNETLTLKGDGQLVGVSGVTDPATELHVDGALTLNEKSSDPANPSEGRTVIWMSDGTGSGDDGDVMMKITAGGTTKTVTLVDFSAA